ncbi:MAG: rane-bound lytic murein transglycosylase [Alphaproteobacteria bacterium]|jgi:membrane-bound lytic murein transglycosylase B|nr:rane-bound lytic murein transglycosylase [Alphaproteobacteria bacterium]
MIFRGARLAVLAAAFVTLAGTMTNAAPAPVAPPEEEARFHAFIRDFRAEALKAGIMLATYDRAVSTIDLNPKVEELNEKQPEFVRPIWDYLAGAITDARVSRGRDQMAAHAQLFARLQDGYGVPREVLTAIWGLETGYGQNEGSFNLFEALATLAYDGPRMEYGRRQFIAALKIAEVESRDPTTMTGSWAGAFGHTQFVPTTFLEHAVDGDGDGKRDLWNSPADALASAANYLKESGWRPGESWGEEVQLPAGFAYEQAEASLRKPIAEWAKLGVRNAAGGALPDSAEEAAILLPAGYRGPAFLVRNNFNVILRYNSATAYALAIGLLSDRLKGAGIVQAKWPVDEVPLDEASRTALQEGLTDLGFSTGGADGVLGRRTQQAIRDYQKSRGLPADGFATPALLTQILNERGAKPPSGQ